MSKTAIYRFLFAGGGTGGHLYPALAVAQQIKVLKPEAEILFVGTKKKIEARVVPQYGFDFKSIWISGFSRKLTLSNLLFPLKVVVSMIQSLLLVMKFKPRVAIGSGAYVSGPAIWAASVLGSKIILLEQNSYPGITNRMLEKKAEEIHITFEESKKFFRNQNKLKLTGNPVRMNLALIDKIEALKNYRLDSKKKTVLVIGGSGGSKNINEAVSNSVSELLADNIQLIWQTGQTYFDNYRKFENESVRVFPFIDDMTAAFSACDLLIARAGATTITEVSYLKIPVIFVPSSHVAANHQYKNAKAISDASAGILIEDKNLNSTLADSIKKIINDEKKLEQLRRNIAAFAKPEAARIIAEDALRLAEKI
ncbi:MAG: undecaprenyldiphospho-muramoylpentapeptide beta-N-acetylglucosaminyltransferase [Melioribacteraceae bacterium]|nr:undecaprenyldiphospho-muramoylpentapeptide beta-N-acetylglucosaminyltransferase [Melioribacteraceae bacterium]